MTNYFWKETAEFQGVSLVDNAGDPVTEGVELCVTPYGERPVTWVAPVEVDGAIGVMIENFDPGRYLIWSKVTDSPEAPVDICGRIVVQ